MKQEKQVSFNHYYAPKSWTTQVLYHTHCASAKAVSAPSPSGMHDYTQASGNNKSEVIIWTSLCQLEETKCTHTDRK